MKTITFNNGKTLKVSQEVANIIKDRIISGGKNFQCFSQESDNVSIIINVSEICFLDK
jgi:uncharacterized protein YlzI (FlbEa/FlbD family)